MKRLLNVSRQLPNIPVIFLSIILLGAVALISSQKINFLTADLGRHLMTGQQILRGNFPFWTNYYSFTFPDFPVVNHHWASGLLFCLVFKMSGFFGLSFFNVSFLALVFFVFFQHSLRRGGFYAAFVSSVLVLPMALYRVEVRPEVFSFLFLGVYLNQLQRFFDREINASRLCLLVVLQACWVNLHIFFALGIFMVAVFLSGSLLSERGRHARKPLGGLLVAVLFASLLNPSGVAGLMEPLLVFRDYGYKLAENQGLIFMYRRFHSWHYAYAQIFSVAFGALIAIKIFSRKKTDISLNLGIFFVLIFGLLGWRMVRCLPLFGFFSMTILSEFIAEIQRSKWKSCLKPLTVGLAVCLLFSGFIWRESPYQFMGPRLGMGLLPGVNNSAAFFLNEKIEGPIFNNYDIGGYLIFHFFDKIRPFVDNRPEAYPRAFFRDVYVPMQESEEQWHHADSKFEFNCIYFYRLDVTPWAQPFLIRRLQDPAWAPVFVDAYTLILLKRNHRNAKIIAQYELPKNLFVVSREN